MRMLSFLAVIAFLFCGAACNATGIAQPSTITVEKALSEIGTGLNQLNQNAHAGFKPGEGRTFGMSVDEVTVTFNVTASATDNGSLSVDLSAAPPAVPGVSGKASAAVGTTVTGSRGNTITIHFKNPIYAADDTVISHCATQPDNLDKLLKAVSDHQFNAIR